MKCENLFKQTIGKTRILLAKDNPTQVSVMKAFLEINDHEVILAGDGPSLFSAIETQNPDVILLDRLLSDIDGATVCRRLKQNRDTSGIPIIMLTDRSSTPDKIAALAAGADDLISMPYDEEELSALICARSRTKWDWDELKQKTHHLEEMLTRVETLADLDSLTGLFNRRRIEAVLAVEFKRATRYRLPLSCLMLDIDHFKEVNDRQGHLAGDDVIRQTARIIQNSIRDVDMAARWGGDEFIILNPNTPKKDALIVGERILKAISNNKFPSIGGRIITVSTGIGGIPHPAIDTVDKLVHAADLALYDAKKNGRNRVQAAA